MNKTVLITSMDFIFENGEEQPFTHVLFRFKSLGTSYMFEGEITVNKDEYHHNKENLVKLIITKHVQNFGYDLV